MNTKMLKAYFLLWTSFCFGSRVSALQFCKMLSDFLCLCLLPLSSLMKCGCYWVSKRFRNYGESLAFAMHVFQVCTFPSNLQIVSFLKIILVLGNKLLLYNCSNVLDFKPSYMILLKVLIPPHRNK